MSLYLKHLILHPKKSGVSLKAINISPVLLLITLRKSIKCSLAWTPNIWFRWFIWQIISRQTKMKLVMVKHIHHKWKVIKNGIISSALGFDFTSSKHFSVMQLMTLLWEVHNLYIFSWRRKLMKKDGLEINYVTTF